MAEKDSRTRLSRGFPVARWLATRPPALRGKGPDLHGRRLLSVILVVAFVWSLLQVDWGDSVVHSGGGAVFIDLLEGFATPDFSSVVVEKSLRATWTTVIYAVAGLSLAVLMAWPLAAVSAGLFRLHSRQQRWLRTAARIWMSLLRSIHELVWAWLFVAAIGLSPFAAIFALAIPYAGILGRIYADRLADVPEPPLRSLRQGGAGEATVLLYGRIPIALADLASYTFYRFECGLRSSAIMGFVGLGGLGMQIQLALDDLAYSQASTYLLGLVVLIAATEVWSSQVRKRLVT